MSTPEMNPEQSEAILLRDAMIAGLAGAAADLSEVGKELYRASVLTKVQRAVLFSILGLILLMSAGLFGVGLQNKSNGAIVRDCTDPSGECYQRNSAQTALLIAQLVAQNQASAWCSGHAATIPAYRVCIKNYPK